MGANPTDLLQFDKLSNTGKLLVQKRDEILERWTKQVRIVSERAAELEPPILIDTLPSFLDNLAEALSPDYPRGNATEDSTIAEEHGGERARLSNYSLADVIAEYQVLRDAVISVLSKQIQLTEREERIIQVSFNVGIRESASTFALVHTEIREQFVATLTHDLRNPLNSISMASQLLQDEKLSSEGHGLVMKIIENSRRMDRMIQDLLDVTYVRAGGRLSLRLGEVCLYEIVNDVITQMTLSHGNKFIFKGKPLTGYWDSDFIKRAIENLASNAVKYGDPSAPITVDFESFDSRVTLKVHNEGKPIPIAEQETIFQSYRRSHATKGSKKGWGIGLALVRAVAEAHGGSIQLDSAVGRGTTFSISMPMDSRHFQDAPTTPQ